MALIGKEITPTELASLSEGLTANYQSDLSRPAKLKQGIILTGKALRELGWDNRGWAGRLGMTTAIGTVVLFGSQSAGIAALGTAIGVPLWVVFGAGASFLGKIIEKFTGGPRVETSYTIIDAKMRRDDA